MRLKIGDPAPQFTTTDVRGQKIALSDYQKQKVLLCFYRYAGCPLCNFALVRIIENYHHFQSEGLAVIAFFQSPKASIEKYITPSNPPFSIVADPEKHIYDLYGIESSLLGGFHREVITTFSAAYHRSIKQRKIDGELFLMPGEFIVSTPQQTLILAHYGANWADFTPFFEIENAITFGGD